MTYNFKVKMAYPEQCAYSNFEISCDAANEIAAFEMIESIVQDNDNCYCDTMESLDSGKIYLPQNCEER